MGDNTPTWDGYIKNMLFFALDVNKGYITGL